MFRRKIIQKRVIALILAVVLLAAIPLMTTASAMMDGEKAEKCPYCGGNVQVLMARVGLRCYYVTKSCKAENPTGTYCFVESFFSHEGRNVNGYCSTCDFPW